MLKKNKSIALVMILALLIITSSCAPKNTQAEIDKPAKTSTSWERKLCRSKLDIISSYGDDQAFHPKVLNFEKPWNGYRYWMAYTPYPGADQRKENPHGLWFPMTRFIGNHLKEREKLFHLIH